MSQSGFVRRPISYLVLALAIFNGRSSVLAADKPETPGRYNGPGSCAASACHGGVEAVPAARTRKGIRQNEYFVWASRDPHFGSFNTLQGPRSLQMAKILELKIPPTEEPVCLKCHALAPPASLKVRDFAVEGVSCESCHGASSGWFAQHFGNKWNTEESIKNGMQPIDDVVKRSETCLECHLGTKGQEVDHRMIAAGHPDLFFELDLFSAKQPRHWKEPPQWKNYAADPNFGVRLWAVGQAVQLKKALDRLAGRADRAQAQGTAWPEFSELDCFSCHHSVRSNQMEVPANTRTGGMRANVSDSWRQQRGYDQRMAGSPPWNSAHYTVFLMLLQEIDAEGRSDLQTKLDELYQVASRLNSAPRDVRDKASIAGTVAAKVVDQVNRPFDRPTLARLLQRISGQGERIANQDTRSAEQAYMALDSLFRCYDNKIGEGAGLNTCAYPSVGAAIDALNREFDNPSAYSAPRFAAGMKKVHVALQTAGIGPR